MNTLKLILYVVFITFLLGCQQKVNKIENDRNWIILNKGSDGITIFYYIVAPDSHDYISVRHGGLCHAAGCRKCNKK